MNVMNHKIVTIIVTYNGLRWIETTLCSLRKSTYATSIIVVDNNSTDGTAKFVRDRFPDVSLIESPKNIGFGRANNIAIKEALKRKADYVFLLNQDASVFQETIKRMVELLSIYRDFGILSPVHLDGTGMHLDYGFSHYIKNTGCEALLSNLVITDSEHLDICPLEFVNAAAWMISRECLELVGGFDPLFFMYGEDNDYTDRVKGKGFKIGIVPGIYIIHDRDQHKLPLNLSIKSNINWELSRSLVRLKKNCTRENNRFLKTVVGEYIFIAKQITKSFFKLDFKIGFTFIILMIRVTLLLPAITRSRKICQQEAGVFVK